MRGSGSPGRIPGSARRRRAGRGGSGAPARAATSAGRGLARSPRRHRASWTGSGDTALNGPLASAVSIAIVMIPTTSSTWTQLIHWRPEPSRPPTWRRNGSTSSSSAFASGPITNPFRTIATRTPSSSAARAAASHSWQRSARKPGARSSASVAGGRVEALVAVRARDVDEDRRRRSAGSPPHRLDDRPCRPEPALADRPATPGRPRSGPDGHARDVHDGVDAIEEIRELIRVRARPAGQASVGAAASCRRARGPGSAR